MRLPAPPSARPTPALSLLEEARAIAGNPGQRCTLYPFVATLSAPDRRDYDAAMADPTIQTRALHRVLARRGFKGGEDVIKRHRLGNCAYCAKRATA